MAQNGNLKVLYIAGLRPRASGEGIAKGLEATGVNLRLIPTSSLSARQVPSLLRIMRRIIGRELTDAKRIQEHNRNILEQAKQVDLVIFTDIRSLNKATLTAIQQEKPIFFYKTDDMFNPANQPRNFFELVPLFDAIFTTKSYNVAEYLAHGAKRAIFVNNAYAPHLHNRIALSEEDRQKFGCDVGFTGTFVPDRADFLARLVRELPEVQFKIWGWNWEKMNRLHYRLQPKRWALWRSLRPFVQGYPVWGEDMSRALQASKINLGLLNKQNRDVQTKRSMEIPACGGFLLAERTDEHRALFVEGKELDCFSSLEELVIKIRYYLAHDDVRRQVAAAGYVKVTQGGYRYQDRAAEMIDVYRSLTTEAIE